MQDDYDIAGVILRVHHDGTWLFRSLESEMKYYGSQEAAAPHCSASIEKRQPMIIPKKAVRSYTLDGQAIYMHEGNMYLLGKDNGYAICMDFGKKRMTVDYTEESKSLQTVSRWLLKWLIIKTAEERGISYIHASAAHYKGKNIIFCGDSHCGKSSSLIRLVQNGARAISDDSVIFDGTHIIPFTLNTSLDEDLERRFGIKTGSFDIGDFMDHSQRYKGADILIFLKVWNNDTSEIKPLEGKRAIMSLMRGYQKELSFTIYGTRGRDDPELSKKIFMRYSELVDHAKCFEFYAGSNEREVRETLIGFLDGQ